MKTFKKLTLAFLLIFIAKFSFSQENIIPSPLKKKETEILNKDYVNFKIDTLTNKNLLNKVTVINFWFEACSPCIAELEGFNKLYEANKSNKNFQFLSFNTDNLEKIKKNVEKFKVDFPVIAIDRVKASQMNYQSGFPATFIINSLGKVIYVSFGGPIDKKKVTEKIMTIYNTKVKQELAKLK